MIKELLYLPFLVQTIVITADEFYYHHKRGLPKWERIGHPLDTLTIIICLAFVLWMPYQKLFFWIYLLLATFSAIFVTKDEFVHHEYCNAKEQWLHALLFLNHPLVLFTTGWMWKLGICHLFLTFQLCMASLFGLYQTVYWNFVRDQ